MENQIDKILPTKEAVDKLVEDLCNPSEVKFYGKDDYKEFKKDFGQGSVLSQEAKRLFNSCPCENQSREECEICRDTDSINKGMKTANN